MFSGTAWTFLAALLLGTFALPSKYIRNYAWENMWGVFSLVGLLIIPAGFSGLVIKGLWATYAEVSPSIILGVIALGFVWGCGICCWGHGLAMVGLALTYSLAMGTMALVGSILPFFLGNADKAFTSGGMTIIAGVLVCIIGVAVNGYAGLRREKSQELGSEGSPKKKVMLKGIIICVLAGLFSSCCNIAFHVGSNIGNIAAISREKYSNAPYVTGLSVWTLICFGGFISCFGFCVIKLFKNKTWNNFVVKGPGINFFLATLMAAAHFASLFFYGFGAWKLGVLGTTVGFAIFQSGSLVIGNGLGVFTGEWKGSDAKSRTWLAIGLVILIIGIIVVSVGNSMS